MTRQASRRRSCSRRPASRLYIELEFAIRMATKPAVSTRVRHRRAGRRHHPLLDTNAAAVKRLIAKGKERGYITFDELNAVLPPEHNSSEQIEDVMAMLSEMGIQVVEGEESEDGEAVPGQGREVR